MIKKLNIIASLTKFEEKVKLKALQYGGKLPDILRALAELDFGPPNRQEQALEGYLEMETTGKGSEFLWAKRVHQILTNVRNSIRSEEK